MNKYTLLAILFFSLLFVGCTTNSVQDKKITVTIEPQRYFAEQLVDSLYQIVTMVPPGTSPEAYDPSPKQMTKLAQSQAYFCIGKIGFEQRWMKNIAQNNSQLQIFDNSKGIAWIENDASDHSHEHHDHHEHTNVDPHIWSSPKQAFLIVRNMYDALIQLDESNKLIYEKNLKVLNNKIAETDSIVTALIAKCPEKSFIIYHPALTYFAKDYGLKQYCIEFEGKEPTPDQLQKLITSAKEKNIKTIFIQQEFDKKNAEIIRKEVGCNLVVINPLSYNWQEEIIRIAKSLSDE